MFSLSNRRRDPDDGGDDDECWLNSRHFSGAAQLDVSVYPCTQQPTAATLCRIRRKKTKPNRTGMHQAVKSSQLKADGERPENG